MEKKIEDQEIEVRTDAQGIPNVVDHSQDQAASQSSDQRVFGQDRIGHDRVDEDQLSDAQQVAKDNKLIQVEDKPPVEKEEKKGLIDSILHPGDSKAKSKK